MASVQVFGLPASTDVARVLTCLFEKEMEFQLIRTDTVSHLHQSSSVLAFSNFANSREICRHIAEKYAEKGNKLLLGTGGLERASIEQWLQAEAQNFDQPSSTLLFQLAFAWPMGIVPNEQLIEENERELSKVLDVYERRLEESKYLAGDGFTLADLSHIPNSHYLVTMSKRGRDLFMERENVARWWEDISGRSSWKKVVELQSEHPGPIEQFNEFIL